MSTELDISSAIVSTDTLAQKPIPMYKTARNFNIDVVSLARAARNDIDSVAIIDVPAPVKTRKDGKDLIETPTLSELGGGPNWQFGQIVANKEGGPVNVKDVYYINTDPARRNINHGTAGVGIGSYFSVIWSLQADIVLLIYQVIALSEYAHEQDASEETNPKKPIPVAKLTSKLVGYDITQWRGSLGHIPPHLQALAAASHARLRSPEDVPFYMEIFRPTRIENDLRYVENFATSSEDIDYHESDNQFIAGVLAEILELRSYQYDQLPPPVGNSRRKVDPIRLVETLTLDPNKLYVDISLTVVREAGDLTTHRLRLTKSNYSDDYGRTLVETNLTLGARTFDQLKIVLEGRRDKHAVAHLISLR